MADDCKYLIDRANLHYVRKQASEFLCDLDSRLNIIEAGGGGIVADYLWTNDLFGAPVSGHIGVNNNDFELVREIRISYFTKHGSDISPIIAALAVGTGIAIIGQEPPNSTAIYTTTAIPVRFFAEEYFTIAVVPTQYLNQDIPSIQEAPVQVRFLPNTGAIYHDDLLDVTPDQHHPQLHDIESHTDVDTTTDELKEGQGLWWDADTGMWRNRAAAAESWPTGLISGGEINIGSPSTDATWALDQADPEGSLWDDQFWSISSTADEVEIVAGLGIAVDSYTDPSDPPVLIGIQWGQINEPITAEPPVAGSIVWYSMASTGVPAVPPQRGGVSVFVGELKQYSQAPTPSLGRLEVFLGVTIHNGTVWEDVSNPKVINQAAETLREIAVSVLSPTTIISGGATREIASFQLEIDEGVIWENNRNWHNDKSDPNREALPFSSPILFKYTNRDFTDVGALGSIIDASMYDNAGTVESISGAATTSTIQRLYLDQANNYWMLWGQNTYANFSAALASISADDANTVVPYLLQSAVLLGHVVARRTASNWVAGQSVWSPVGIGAGVGGGGTPITDHDLLNGITVDNHHQQAHKLYGLDADPITPFNQHTDVNITNPMEDAQLLQWNIDEFIPDWRNKYLKTYVGGVIYPPETWTNNSTYIAVANVATEEYPFPTEVGGVVPIYPPDPPFATFQNSSQVRSGYYVTFTESGEVRALQVWIPEVTVDTHYTIVSIEDPNGATPQSSRLPLENTDLTAGEWNTIGIGSKLFAAGAEILLYLESDNYGSTSQVTGGWISEGAQNVGAPPAQNWNHNNANTILRIDKTDLNATDRSAELLGIIAGSTVQFVETAIPTNLRTYTVLAPPVDQITYVEYSVSLSASTGLIPDDEVTTMTAEIPVSQPTKFVFEADKFLTNPVFAAIDSFLQYDGVTQAVDPNNGYGINFNFQQLAQSPDWDLILLGGSGGGSGDFTPDVFEGAGTSGYVPDPVTEEKKHLSDDGTWKFTNYPDILNPPFFYPTTPIRQHLSDDGTFKFTDYPDILNLPFIIPEAPVDSVTYGRLNGTWEKVYSQTESNDLARWEIKQDDYTAVWDEKLRFDSPPNFCQLPPPDQNITGTETVSDILIWNDGATSDLIIEVRPAAGTYFSLDGVDKPIDEPLNLLPSEMVRVSTRILNTSYGVAIEAAARFDGAGTFGFVSNPDGLEQGRYLSDDGTWQNLTVIPAGGIRFEFTYSTDNTVTDPTAGFAKINNTDAALATIASISDETVNGNTIRVWASQLAAGDFLGFVDESDGFSYYYTVDSAAVDHTTWWEVPITIYLSDPLEVIPDLAPIFFAMIGNPKSRMPTGGLENEVLSKSSSVDYATYWQDISSFINDDDLPADGWTYGRYWDGVKFDWNTGHSNPVTFAATANFGIGTTVPRALLHVSETDLGLGTGGSADIASFEGKAATNAYVGVFGDVGKKIGFRLGTPVNQVLMQLAYSDADYSLTFNVSADGTASANEKMRIEGSTGNVGIGTTAPVQRLHVAGTTNSGFQMTYDGSGHTVNDGFSITQGAAAAYLWNYELSAMVFATDNTERMRIDSAGNVGIGTTSPAGLLHVSDGDSGVPPNANAGISIESGTGTNIQFMSPADNTQSILFGTPTANNRGRIRYHTTDEYMSFNTAQAERMRIDNAGNVGIGTTSPEVKLDVVGSGLVRAWTPVGSTVGLFDNSGFGNASVSIISASTHQSTLSFGDEVGQQRGRIRYNMTDDRMEFLVSTTNIAAVIDSAGRVGIATSSPNAKLDVDDTGGFAFQGYGAIQSRPAYAGGKFYSAFRAVPSEAASAAVTNSGLFMGALSTNNQLINFSNIYRSAGLHRPAATTAASIGYVSGAITFLTDSGLTADVDYTPTERMRIDNAGAVKVGSPSGATGAGSVNVSDGYYVNGVPIGGLTQTEGSWTPTIANKDVGGVSGTINYFEQGGKWTRIGNLVTVSFWVRFGSTSTSSSTAFAIDGLPFKSQNFQPESGHEYTGSISRYLQASIQTNGQYQLATVQNTTKLAISVWFPRNISTVINYDNFQNISTGTITICGSITYKTDDA